MDEFSQWALRVRFILERKQIHPNYLERLTRASVITIKINLPGQPSDSLKTFRSSLARIPKLLVCISRRTFASESFPN